MKTCKITFLVILITSFALLYVHQQILLLKISYEVQKNEESAARLLDRNRILMYNIAQLKSPQTLQAKISKHKQEFAIPLEWQVVKATQITARPSEDVTLAKSEQKAGFFSLLRFNTKTAEARPIK